MSGASILHGDALEQLSSLPVGSVDAVLCDPPYVTTRCAWDDVIPLVAMWAELHRVCQPGAPMIFTASMPFTAALVMSNVKEFRACQRLTQSSGLPPENWPSLK